MVFRYSVDAGETVAIVGESGSGKSVGVMSLIRLIPQPPGKIVDGEVWFDGQDLLKLNEDQLRDVRGNRIAMIFQDPMTSLNPVLTVGRQITESLELHLQYEQGAKPQTGRRAAGVGRASRLQTLGWMTIHTSFPAACANV